MEPWWAVCVAVAVVTYAVIRLDLNGREWRAFDAALTRREAVDDESLVGRYFPGDDMPADIPARVRRVFAAEMDYPAEKLLPDDDFTFFWAELDGEPLVRGLEVEFGVTIHDGEACGTAPTIRAVSRLMAEKRAPAHGLSGAAGGT